MKNKNTHIAFFLIMVTLLSMQLVSCSKTEEQKEAAQAAKLRKEKVKGQKKLSKVVGITLRAAHTAYNVGRYELASENFEKAVNKGWIDGIDLYLYADSLAHLNNLESSKTYFQKAYNELLEFYPNHAFIQTLKAQGYE